MSERGQAMVALTMNSLAFTICFACWMLNGVLITFLVEAKAFDFSNDQIGWLIGIPVLTGALTRLPVGVLTDRYGGRRVFSLLMLGSAVPLYFTAFAESYTGFLLCGLGFGLTGASFAVGVAYTSLWFPKERIGTALGVFGAGNAGAALTSICGPMLLESLTATDLEGWRLLPKIYAAALVVMAVLFFATTRNRIATRTAGQGLGQRLAPLRELRVWRFGLYYFLVFGGFVTLAQWMIPYYVNAYGMSVTTAGLLAAIFSFPSGVVRALGGWLSDRVGARTVMYWIFGTTALVCMLLCVPRMDILTPGRGVLAVGPGQVRDISASEIVVAEQRYSLKQKPDKVFDAYSEDEVLVFPQVRSWQEPVVSLGEKVVKKQLLARGRTHIYFQANVWIFTALVFIVGVAMGIGKAAVYKHIPSYFPDSVGVTGGMVGVLGGLGGFICPILFGYLLGWTGLWASCWMFLTVLTVVSLVWMLLVIRRMVRAEAPAIADRIE